MGAFYWDDWFAMYPENKDLNQEVGANLTEGKHALLIAQYLKSIQNMLYTLYNTVEYKKPGSIASQVYTILENIGKVAIEYTFHLWRLPNITSELYNSIRDDMKSMKDNYQKLRSIVPNVNKFTFSNTFAAMTLYNEGLNADLIEQILHHTDTSSTQSRFSYNPRINQPLMLCDECSRI
eukprot:1244042-Rhodomonas_salina.1